MKCYNSGAYVMSQTKSARIQDHFAELTDPRRREVTYPLINVVVIAVCAVICGADTRNKIESDHVRVLSQEEMEKICGGNLTQRRPGATVGLERIGGVMVYDVTDPLVDHTASLAG